MAEMAEGVDVNTAVTREEAGTLAVQGDAAHSMECVERGFCEVHLSVATDVSKIRRLRDDRCPLPDQHKNVA